MIRTRSLAAVATGLVAGTLLSLVSCIGGQTARAYDVNSGGDVARGKNIIVMKSCGSCHIIPGINGARGLVGPPLTQFAKRTYIGGEAANQPENLVKWLMAPESIEPHTAMPNLGLTEQQARDAAAYLYTLN